MYRVYCSEGGYRTPTQYQYETKEAAQFTADQLNNQAEEQGGMDWLYYYVRKFTPKTKE